MGTARRIPVAAIAMTGAVAIITAVVAGIAVYLIADALGAIPDPLPGGAEQFGIPAIVFATVLTIALGTVAFWAFTRFSSDPARNFAILAGIVTATSLTGPLSLDDPPAGFVLTLIVLHLVAAAVTVALFLRLDRGHSGR